MLLRLLLLLYVVGRLSTWRCRVRPLLVVNDLNDLRLFDRDLNVVGVEALLSGEYIHSPLRDLNTL